MDHPNNQAVTIGNRTTIEIMMTTRYLHEFDLILIAAAKTTESGPILAVGAGAWLVLLLQT